jgi:hypothetical protein
VRGRALILGINKIIRPEAR